MKLPGIFKDFHLRSGNEAKNAPDAAPEQAPEGIHNDDPATSKAQVPIDSKASEQNSPAAGREPDSVESLWFALLDDPNNEKNLNRLIRFCQTRKGPASVNAALTELSHEEGSYLPQLMLASMALERKEPEEAIKYYKGLLTGGHAGDYPLLRMSADMGRNGYPAEMIAIVGPAYNPDKHGEYIGLNLLQAYKETGDISGGKGLYDRLKSLNRAKIAPGLQSFERVYVPGVSRNDSKNIQVAASEEQQSHSIGKPATVEIPGNPPQAATAGKEVKVPESAGLPARAKIMQIPIWRRWIPALDDLLPKAETGPRIGLYLYADTTPRNETGDAGNSSIKSAQLAAAVPMSVGEQLLFTSPVVPIVLFPVSFDKGPDMGSAEPDVQSLFSLCVKESLDFLITGTVCRTHDGYLIRTWLIDKTKKTARIISKDIPSRGFGLAMAAHVEEMISLFRDKNYAFEVKRLGLTYCFPSGLLYEEQLIALERLALRALVDEGICSGDILCDPETYLGTFVSLCKAKPLCQNYLMMLLAGMLSDKERGGQTYRKYKELLYDNAHRMQYIPCVTASQKELDKILKG